MIRTPPVHEWSFDAVRDPGDALAKLEAIERDGWEIFNVQRIDAGYWIVARKLKGQDDAGKPV